MINYSTTVDLAAQHRTDLLREAETARIARQARQARTNDEPLIDRVRSQVRAFHVRVPILGRRPVGGQAAVRTRA